MFGIYSTGMFGIKKEKFERYHIVSKSVAAKNKVRPSLIVNASYGTSKPLIMIVFVLMLVFVLILDYI